MAFSNRVLQSVVLLPYLLTLAVFVGHFFGDRAAVSAGALVCPESQKTSAGARVAVASAKRYGIQVTYKTSSEEMSLNTANVHLSGAKSIEAYLSGDAWLSRSTTTGLRVALLLLGVQGLLLLNRKTIAPYAALFVPIGLLAAMAYGLPCTACKSVNAVDVAPSAALALVALVGTAFAFQSRVPKPVWTVLLCALCLVPSVQAALLIQTPLLCPLCITMAAAMVCLAFGVNHILEQGRLPAFSGRGNFRFGVACLVAAMIQAGRIAISAPGPVPPIQTDTQIAERVINRPLATFAPKLNAANQVVMVSQQGCPHCEAAQARLSSQRVDFVNLPACAIGGSDVCFDTDRASVGFPTFLFVDSSGVVRDVFVGWPGGEQDVIGLINRIKTWRKS